MGRHLGEFEQLVLFALLRLDHDAPGLRIRHEVESRADRSVSAGALYTALERLESRGLVVSRLGDPTPRRGGKRRLLYTLTPSGAQALNRTYQAVSSMARGQAARLRRLVAQM